MLSVPATCSTSRAGKTVEIGNTDAEGRLVLADALALADEEQPDTLVSFATLTGAARVALGRSCRRSTPMTMPSPRRLPRRATASAIRCGACRSGPATRRCSTAPVADMNNVSDGPFAGSVTAALFLRRFVKQARRFAHFDIYGWRPAAKPLGPKGGEVQAARALFEVLRSSGAPLRRAGRNS